MHLSIEEDVKNLHLFDLYNFYNTFFFWTFGEKITGKRTQC
jgi:hypothetical protein